MNELIKEIKDYMGKTNEGGEAWGEFLIKAAEEMWQPRDMDVELEAMTIISEVRNLTTDDDCKRADQLWENLTEFALDYQYYTSDSDSTDCEKFLISFLGSWEEKEILKMFFQHWRNRKREKSGN